MSMQSLLYTICILFIIINILYFKKQKNGIWNAIIGMGSGVAFLIPLHYILQFSGILLAINYFTLLVSLAFGIPGVIAMMIYSVLF